MHVLYNFVSKANMVKVVKHSRHHLVKYWEYQYTNQPSPDLFLAFTVVIIYY